VTTPRNGTRDRIVHQFVSTPPSLTDADRERHGAPPGHSVADGRTLRRARREIDLLAVASLALCIALGIASRHHLNADGVSYLDLAARLRDGDWRHFVQGYWSPLYPALLALAGLVSGSRGAPSLPAVHALNVLLACTAVFLLWRTCRRRGDAVLGRVGFAALLLCDTRPLRVDAVTPDLLLIVALLVVTLEWLEAGGRRWVRVGLAMGVAFLAKTSIWPWLVAWLLLSLVGPARSRSAGFAVRSAGVAGLAMLAWILPLSVKTGYPTLGSAARLNACWYLAACDSRSPDTHQGAHVSYRSAELSAGATITVADFGATPWTYPPWSDPTAWDRGTRSRNAHRPSLTALIDGWARNTLAVFALWLAPLLFTVLLPTFVLTRPEFRHTLSRTPRPVLDAVVLGEAGVLQFVAVHVEPRLIAPFALMAALGVVWWRLVPAETPAGAGPSRAVPPPPAHARGPRWLSCAGLGAAAVLVIATLWEHGLTNIRIAMRHEGMGQMRSEKPISAAASRIVVIGASLPLLTDVWRIGGRIVAQIPPASAAAVMRLPPAEQSRLVAQLLGGEFDMIWFSADRQPPDAVPR
jgi:hypothetical protein